MIVNSLNDIPYRDVLIVQAPYTMWLVIFRDAKFREKLQLAFRINFRDYTATQMNELHCVSQYGRGDNAYPSDRPCAI